MFAWFTWGIVPTIIINILPIVAGIVLLLFSNITFTKSALALISITLFVIIQLYVVREFKITAVCLALLRISNIALLLLLNDKFKVEIFKFLTKSISYIIAISLFFWILYLLGINLPNYKISSPYGPYINYYFFILYDETSFFSIIPRFSSIFLEPGYLGMLTTFLIISNKFDFRKNSVKIFFAATLFSFSLAAFLVILLTFFIFIIKNSSRPLIYVFIFFSLISSMYIISVNLNSGENAIYNYLFKRLEFNGGEMAGYNRFSSDLEVYYNEFIQSKSKYFGIGEEEFRKLSWEGGNAGYKIFIIQYGFFATFLVFLFYIIFLIDSSTLISWLLFLAFFLIFLQAAYPLIECELIVYITGIQALKKRYQIN
jgi:hypothetical protein